MNEIALSLPFSLDVYGRITSSTEQSKIWADRVRAVIGTNLRERIMRPSFGTLVPASFMDTQTEAEAAIKREVAKGFSSLLPALTLNSVDISFDEYLSAVNVTINYNLPNNEVVDTTVAIAYSLGTTPPYEENK